MERIVKKILPSVLPLSARLRVAAYARVSSGKDEMLQSLAAQVSYYSNLIQQRPDWEYAGVYADEALTGTKDTRPKFQRLIADCKNGKIDPLTF
jgi:DNA invertase Pin-like site-specific DNA recombinase